MSNNERIEWRYQRIEEPGYVGHSYVWGPKVSIHCAGGNLDYVESDMLLIAAAPELLENLIGCMEALASHVPDCIEVQCARAAIAKVTGESQ